MEDIKVKLSWKVPNLIEEGYRVYRSESPMDINDMPDAIIELPKNTTKYDDYNVIEGNFYYYRVSCFIPDYEVFSKEVMVEAKSWSDQIALLSGNELVIKSLESGQLIYTESFTSNFTNDDYVMYFPDGNYIFTNQNTLYIKDNKNKTKKTADFPHKLSSIDYDDNRIYVTSYTTMYVLDYELNIVHSIGYGNQRYVLRAIGTNNESQYYAHGRASGSAYGWYIRRKSNDTLVSNYNPGSSTVREIEFHGDKMYAYHTGSGRRVSVVDLNTLNRQNYYASSTQPQYVKTVMAEKDNSKKIFAVTRTPERVEMLSLPFNRQKVVDNTQVFCNSIDIYDDRIYYVYNGNLIKSCDLDGNDVKDFSSSPNGKQIFSFATYKIPDTFST